MGELEADANWVLTLDLNTVENWKFGLSQGTLWGLSSSLIVLPFADGNSST